MNWKTSLDKYLTSPFDDGFDNWCELVTESMSNEFWERNENWILDSDLCNKWLNKLQDKEPELAGQIIERAFKRYVSSV